MLTETKKRGKALDPTPEGYLAPWTEMAEIRRRMENLFNPVVGYTPWPRLFGETYAIEPPVDIYEAEEVFYVFVFLPGFVPEHVHVEATNDTITILGERPSLLPTEYKTTHRSSGLSDAGKFNVTYSLPAEIDPDKIRASFNAGVLHLEIPKAEHVRARTVKVEIPSSK